MAALLEAREVTKTFAGVVALESVSLDVGEHELVGLIGPNGAGKTTLFNCLLGMLRPDAGSITFAGHDLAGLPTHRRARLGIGRTFQRIELFPGMTPTDHLLVAERARRGDGALWKDVLGLGKPRTEELDRVAATLELLGMYDEADQPIESLSLGRGRLVEVGRALMTEPTLLLLDEPSSGLDRYETHALTETLRTVHAERGTAVLLVEHDVEMVRNLVDECYVLDFGVVIAHGATAEVMADERVRTAYLGSQSVSERPKPDTQDGAR